MLHVLRFLLVLLSSSEVRQQGKECLLWLTRGRNKSGNDKALLTGALLAEAQLWQREAPLSRAACCDNGGPQRLRQLPRQSCVPRSQGTHNCSAHFRRRFDVRAQPEEDLHAAIEHNCGIGVKYQVTWPHRDGLATVWHYLQTPHVFAPAGV
jgi:hypothetical protein